MLLVKQISMKLFLRIAHENTVSSELVNRDVDMATEIGRFTSDQIMLEVSIVIRAQAVKRSLNLLKLLVGVSLALFPKKKALLKICWKDYLITVFWIVT